MCMYIGIEDLAASALIELLQAKQERFVRFSDLIDYGTEVVEILRGKKLEAVLLYSKERTFHILEDCSRYFRIETKDGWDGIALKEGVSTEDLASRFLSLLASQILDAMRSDRAVSRFRRAA